MTTRRGDSVDNEAWFARKRAKLPELCYVHIWGAHPGRRIGIVKRGEMGYYETDYDSKTASQDIVAQVVDDLNYRLGITVKQAMAMQIGSMRGWHVPGADPDQL